MNKFEHVRWGPWDVLVFYEFLQNFSEGQILFSLCSVVFHALTLKLPFQTSLSVVLELPVSLTSHEKMSKFQENEHTPVREGLSGVLCRKLTLTERQSDRRTQLKTLPSRHFIGGGNNNVLWNLKMDVFLTLILR